jgi:phage-related protein
MLTLITTLIPILLTAVKKVVSFIANILHAVYVVNLIVEYLVQVWDTIVATGKMVAEYVTQLAKDIYDYVSAKIELMIDKAVNTMKLLYSNAKDLAKKVYYTAVSFVEYAKQRIKDALNMAQTIANQVAHTVTSAVQNLISIQVERLDACVRDMLSIANRVQNMDERLDRLYYLLLNAMIEQEEGFFISLLNLYNLTKADIKVDQGGMIRRMANNINGWNDAYKEVESWLLAIL